MKPINDVMNGLKEWLTSFVNIAAGLLGTVVGYFLPIRDVVHLLILLFITDVFFGYLVDKRQNNARFKVAVIWNHTIPRMLISIILVIATFMWDLTYKQELVSTYNVVGWFISGVLIFSIAENAFILTKWKTFLKIRNMIRKRTDDEMGEDNPIDADEETKNIMRDKTKYGK